jgi:hypothetical protein
MILTHATYNMQAFINKYDHANHFPLMFTKNSLLFFSFFMWIAQRAYLVFCYSPEQPCSLRRSPVVTTAGTAATPPSSVQPGSRFAAQKRILLLCYIRGSTQRQGRLRSVRVVGSSIARKEWDMSLPPAEDKSNTGISGP